MSFILSLQQNQRTRGQNRFCPEVGEVGRSGEVAQTMYTHVSKCKNNKIKEVVGWIRAIVGKKVDILGK
jgi:hypothetical protein